MDIITQRNQKAIEKSMGEFIPNYVINKSDEQLVQGQPLLFNKRVNYEVGWTPNVKYLWRMGKRKRVRLQTSNILSKMFGNHLKTKNGAFL